MPLPESRSHQSQDQGRSRSDSVASKRASVKSQGDTLAAPQNAKADRRRSFSSIKSTSQNTSSAFSKGHHASAMDTLRPDRSPFLTRDDRDLEDSSGSDFDDHLPVTGFAVASNRRNADFHALFPAVDEGDYLIEGELNLLGYSVDVLQTMGVRLARIYSCKVVFTSRKTTSVSTQISLAG